MRSQVLSTVVCVLVSAGWARGQQPSSCASLMKFKPPNVEITKAAPISAGSTESIPWSQSRSAPLPAYCRVEGVINRRAGVDGEGFGVAFALALQDKWNSDFLMQGGGGSNGVVLPPLGLNAAGDTPALIRGFAVVSTDTAGLLAGGEKQKLSRPYFDNVLIKGINAPVPKPSQALPSQSPICKFMKARRP